MSCKNPQATPRVMNPGSGPVAWCGGCQSWQPAAQVAWDRMKRSSAGTITATYAALPHGGAR